MPSLPTPPPGKGKKKKKQTYQRITTPFNIDPSQQEEAGCGQAQEEVLVTRPALRRASMGSRVRREPPSTGKILAQERLGYCRRCTDQV
jgi:hypothetical protein